MITDGLLQVAEGTMQKHKAAGRISVFQGETRATTYISLRMSAFRRPTWLASLTDLMATC